MEENIKNITISDEEIAATRVHCFQRSNLGSEKVLETNTNIQGHPWRGMKFYCTLDEFRYRHSKHDW